MAREIKGGIAAPTYFEHRGGAVTSAEGTLSELFGIFFQTRFWGWFGFFEVSSEAQLGTLTKGKRTRDIMARPRANMERFSLVILLWENSRG